MPGKIWTIHREKSNGKKPGGTNLKVLRDTKIGGDSTKIGGAKV
jgi:hypothetical protein